MSSKLLGSAWEHLPWSGGMLVLALKLVDNAHDDGRHIFPSIDELAAKTKQSDRTVQRQLRVMEASGWLVCEVRSNGGRNRSSRYRIAPQWIAEPGAFVFRSEAEGEAALAAQAVPVVADAAAELAPEVPADEASHLAAARVLARMRVSGGDAKPRQNVTVAGELFPPVTVTSTTETVTPVSGAYNPYNPQTPPLSPPENRHLAKQGKRSREGLAAEAAEDRRLAEWMFAKVCEVRPKTLPMSDARWVRWCRAIRLMRASYRCTHREIAELFAWANTDPFWANNICSPDALREQYPRLAAERERKLRPPAPAGAPTTTPAVDRGCRWLNAGGLRCTCRGTRSDGAHLDAPWYCAEHWEAIERQRARAGQ